MKKVISLFLSLMMLLSITAGLDFSAYAESYTGDCGDSLTWSLDTEVGELIFTGSGDIWDYSSSSLPKWNSYKSSIKTITLPEGVTSIGAYAFSGLTALKTVNISCTVSKMGEYAFNNCSAITKTNYLGTIDQWVGINFSRAESNPVYYGKNLYINDELVTSVNITSATNIRFGVFYNCQSITNVTVGDTVKSIGKSAFNGCSNLTSILLSNNVASIGSYAFSNCPKLTSINIPSGVSIIDEYTFNGCSNLTKTTGGLGVTQVGNYAFQNCTSLKSVGLGDNVNSIGNYAFYNCSAITDFVLPESVVSIGNYAFNKCTSLVNITFDSSVKSFGEYAFYNCTSLKKVNYLGTIDQWSELTFTDKWESNPLYYAHSLYINNVLVTNVEINSATVISREAFIGCTSIKKVTLGNSVSKIDYYAFNGCTSLTEITVLNDNCTIDNNASISAGTMYGHTGSTAESYAGSHSIPFVSVDTGENARIYTGQCGDSLSWSLNTDTGVLEINGTGNMTDYSSNTLPEWNKYKSCITSVTLSQGVTSIGAYAFSGCTNISSANLPDSLKTIEAYAFNGCTKLTAITIPDSVTEIEDYAFTQCTGLKSASVGNGVTSIGNYAFNSCTGLNTITLGNSLKSIGYCAFNKCSGLTSIVLPNSVTSVGNSAFYNCSGLSSITIGANVKSFGDKAFYGCSGLKKTNYVGTIDQWVEIEFNASTWESNPLYYSHVLYINNIAVKNVDLTTATKINAEAFIGCTSIERVVLPENVNSIGNLAFKDCSNLKSITILNDNCVIDNNASISTGTIYGHIASTSEAYAGSHNISFVSIDIDENARIYTGQCGDDLVWSVNTGTGILEIVGSGKMWDYSSSILPEWNKYKSCITSVTLSQGVTSIGAYAFSGCTNISSVSIPDSLKAIEPYAFNGCTKLTNITIPDSVTEIENYAFTQCTGLKSASVGNGVTSIGNYAFNNCTGLNSITLGSSLKSIGNYAFNRCSGLTLIVLPDSVTSVGNSSFYSCSSLSSITIGANIKSFGENAFYGCTGLKKTNYVGTIDQWVEIEFNISKWESNPLYYSHALYINNIVVKNVDLTTATKINAGAFIGCTSIERVVLPENVNSIGNLAFKDCSNLKSITILNDNCVIDNNASISTGTIYGHIASTSEAYAGSHRISFVSIDNCEHETTREIITQYPTCSKTGLKNIVCTYCSIIIQESVVVPTISHTPGNVVKENEIPTTCYIEGNYDEVVYCTVCGEVVSRNTVTIPKSEHTYTSKIVLPTCTEQGYTIYTCSVCGDSYKSDYVNATGHKFTHTDAVAPTCTTAGKTQTVYCERCGLVTKEQETVAILEHAYVNVGTVSPTCTEQGYTVYRCSTCGDCYNGDFVDALVHDYQPIETVAASCTEKGYIMYRCTRCENTYKEDIPATGHTAVADTAVPATCAKTGLTEGSHCSVCGKILVSQNIIPAITHTVVVDAAVPATLTATGKTQGSHCSVCGEVLVAQQVVPALIPDGASVAVNGDKAVITLSDGSTITVPKDTKETVKNADGTYTVTLNDGSSVTVSSNTEIAKTDDGQLNVKATDNGKTTTVTVPSGSSVVKDGDNYKIIVVNGTETVEKTVAAGETVVIDNSGSMSCNGEHKWDNGAVTIAATCTSEGVMTYTCTVCQNQKIEKIAKVAHKEIVDKAVPATYTTEGKTEGKHCSVCGVVIVAQKPVAKLAKKANTLTVKAKKPTVKFAKLKKKNQTIALKKAMTVSNAQGTVTYKLSSAKKGKKNFKKYFKVAKNGKITVKKGLKKGTYKVKIQVTAAGNTEYNAAVKTVTVKIKVK